MLLVTAIQIAVAVSLAPRLRLQRPAGNTAIHRSATGLIELLTLAAIIAAEWRILDTMVTGATDLERTALSMVACAFMVCLPILQQIISTGLSAAAQRVGLLSINRPTAAAEG